MVAREELLDAELTCGWDVDMRARGRTALTVATRSPQPPRAAGFLSRDASYGEAVGRSKQAS